MMEYLPEERRDRMHESNVWEETVVEKNHGLFVFGMIFKVWILDRNGNKCILERFMWMHTNRFMIKYIFFKKRYLSFPVKNKNKFKSYAKL